MHYIECNEFLILQYYSNDKMTEKRLHPSIPSHLSTDLEVLRAVIERSKFQHRSQPFLRRMREVLRLGRRVELLNTDTEDTKDTEGGRSKAVEGEVVVKVRFLLPYICELCEQT
jgi:hypothetical protein